ncbi:tigger transposable element-derived protein 4-like [Harmonia axyridis]|uniref:tigger transposable element-derived protein 4-like n=1 Tax=Harmonia axyridis TaxID=115357 RepID=UPI001E27744A|nr:tigger transposable element-derived protein 4-like [Harmonia axyridis]
MILVADADPRELEDVRHSRFTKKPESSIGSKYLVRFSLSYWKRRSGICQVCGDINKVSDEGCTEWQRVTLPNLLKNYQAEDIFNADETGLFFNCLPDNTLTFKNQKYHGGKISKQRVTLMIGTNMNGSEKLKLLLIGRSSEPHCFRGIKWLPLDYRANKNA